jgi:hypothetical protein
MIRGQTSEKTIGCKSERLLEIGENVVFGQISLHRAKKSSGLFNTSASVNHTVTHPRFTVATVERLARIGNNKQRAFPTFSYQGTMIQDRQTTDDHNSFKTETVLKCVYPNLPE